MKKILFSVLYFLFVLISTNAQKSDFPKLAGPYFGQTPPGDTPLLFLPEVLVQPKLAHSNIVFTSDGLSAYWCYNGLWYSKVENGFWTKPKMVPFSQKEYEDDSPFISPDDTRFFFTSKRPGRATDTARTENVWVVNLNNGKWSEPMLLPEAVNDPFFHWQVSVDNKGTLYFQYEAETNRQNKRDVWFCKYDGKNYLPAEPCSPMINTEHFEVQPYISPDGSYLIFTRINNKRLDNGRQDMSLFISFKKKDQTWTNAVNLKEYLKYKYIAGCPIVTRDGKYLFFLDMDSNSGVYQRYWISADFVEKLRPKE